MSAKPKRGRPRKGTGVPSTWEVARFRRREAVLQFLVQRKPSHEIAAMLRCSLSTIMDDIAAIREASHAKIMKSTINEVVAGVLDDAAEIDRKAWETFYGTEDPQLRLQALQLLRMNRADKIGQLQRLGAVHEEPRKLQLTAQDRASRIIGELTQERAHELTSMKDHLAFIKVFTDMVGPELAAQLAGAKPEEFHQIADAEYTVVSSTTPESPESPPSEEAL